MVLSRQETLIILKDIHGEDCNLDISYLLERVFLVDTVINFNLLWYVELFAMVEYVVIKVEKFIKVVEI